MALRCRSESVELSDELGGELSGELKVEADLQKFSKIEKKSKILENLKKIE